MAISSYGYTGAVNNVQWAQMAGSLGFDYVAKGPNDCKVSTVSSGTRTVRVATGSIAGGGVLDINGSAVDISLPNVTSGSKWFLIVANRTWQTSNVTTFTYIEGTATKQLPPRATGFGVEDDQPLALVRIAAGQTLPAEVIDLRVVGSNNGVMVGYDDLCLQYLDSVGTVVRIGDVEWSRALSPAGTPVWVTDGTWATVPTQNGFMGGSGWETLRARRGSGGVEVTPAFLVRGTGNSAAIAAGVPFVVGTLPSGLRPTAQAVGTGLVSHGTTRSACLVYYMTNGRIEVVPFTSGTMNNFASNGAWTNFVALNAVTFP